MNEQKKRITNRSSPVADELPAELSPLLRRIYLHRGVGTADQLDLNLRHLLSYHSLKGIDSAASLLADCIETNQHILIVGDFDADGATSTALAMSALTRFGAGKLSYLVPDRFKFGYGLTPAIVDLAIERHPDLIITVDNGISSIEGVNKALAAGIRVLVTDHHLPGPILPNADVIVNPNQPGCSFPSKNLAGVGVIFYVMAALRAELKNRNLIDDRLNLGEMLDLVALGTVADLVPLDHNNRILVHNGLMRMRNGRIRPGIRALAAIAGRDITRLSAMDLGYFIGPRLNAAGRLEDMSIGIECLLIEDEQQALLQAQRLHDLNAQRRELQDQMQAEAESLVSAHLQIEHIPNSLCVFDESWHEGIVGLVASRLKERFHRPTIAFAPSGEPGILKGSARSIPGLHIRDALDAVAATHPDLLSKFGGHAMAAGLSLEADKLAEFRSVFDATVTRLINSESLDAIIESDGELIDDEFSIEQAEVLEQAGPWGQQFPQPLFHGRFKVLEKRIVGTNHVKLKLSPMSGNVLLDAIAFNAEDRMRHLGEEVTLAYRLDVNDYMGRRSVQLIVDYLDA